ncbi:MAG: OmpH family outer membrane protein [Negativicutes bacterium]|nr:OmpH family outer membrane protein [Negativicutes bacterium]
MKKSIILVLALVVTAGLMVSGCSLFNKPIGVVDMQKIMQGSKDAQNLQAQFEAKQKELFDPIDQNKNLSDADRQKQFQDAQKQLMDFGKDLEQQMQTAMKTAMDSVSKEKGLSAILVKGAVANGGVDVTDDVLEKMNAGK